MYTRRISNSFRSELPEWDPRGGAVERGGGRGIRFYTIIERVQSESQGKSPAKNESDALNF